METPLAILHAATADGATLARTFHRIPIEQPPGDRATAASDPTPATAARSAPTREQLTPTNHNQR
jgi:hypothetical protein